MNNKFLNWYSQAVGSVIGMIVCLYSYLSGSLYTFGNITNNLDNIDLSSAMSSFLLFPFCILCFLFSFLKNGKKLNKNDFLESFNSFIVIFTMIVGFIGVSMLFLFPSIFFILAIYLTYHKIEETEEVEQIETETI